MARANGGNQVGADPDRADSTSGSARKLADSTSGSARKLADSAGAGVLAEGLRILGRGARHQPRIFTVACLGGLAFGLLTVAGAYVVGAVVAAVVVPALDRAEVPARSLAAGVMAILGLSLLKVAAIFGRRLGAGSMQFRLQATYRQMVTRRYLELPLAWHRRNATGTLLSNANSDVEALWFPIAPLPFAVGTLFMLVVAVGSLFVVDWSFALVGFGVFPVLFGLNVVYSRLMSPRIGRAQMMRATTSAIAHESFDGALVVKTMGREQEETQRFATGARQLRDAMISVGRLRGVFDPLMEALPSLGTLSVLVVGAIRLRQGAVSVSDVVSVAFLFTVLAFPVRAIGWVLTELPRSVVGWHRVQRVLTATGDMPYGSDTWPDRDCANDHHRAPASLALRSVHFAHRRPDGAEGVDVDGVGGGDGVDDRDIPVLCDVSFVVKSGQTVALVGPTGSGKSTITSLAARLVDPSAGVVELDEHDVRSLRADVLSATVALVAQVPFIFDDTVRNNVALGRPGIDDEAVRAALRLAQAEGFVDRLPQGLDTPVGERGTALSGGQRQRLTLARALAGDPRLLILDDATSAVDPRVEAAILAGLRQHGATVVVVAYRRATIALADEVVYLEQGRVVARGTHPDLLARVPGYAALVTAYERADAERERDHAFGDDEAEATGDLAGVDAEPNLAGANIAGVNAGDVFDEAFR